jgi:hypothetical protein
MTGEAESRFFEQGRRAHVQGLVYIFIALAALGVAGAAYFGLTFSPIEAAVTALAFGSVAVMLVERKLRQRSEARLEKAVEDLARLLSTDAKAGQVLSQRVNAIADTNVGSRLEAIEADISVLGTVTRQLAEALAEFEQAQRQGRIAFAPPNRPRRRRRPRRTTSWSSRWFRWPSSAPASMPTASCSTSSPSCCCRSAGRRPTTSCRA